MFHPLGFWLQKARHADLIRCMSFNIRPAWLLGGLNLKTVSCLARVIIVEPSSLKKTTPRKRCNIHGNVRVTPQCHTLQKKNLRTSYEDHAGSQSLPIFLSKTILVLEGSTVTLRFFHSNVFIHISPSWFWLQKKNLGRFNPLPLDFFHDFLKENHHFFQQKHQTHVPRHPWHFRQVQGINSPGDKQKPGWHEWNPDWFTLLLWI